MRTYVAGIAMIWIVLAGMAQKESGQEAALLPTIKEKKWSNFFLVHEHNNFLATMNNKGELSIQLKDNKGREVGKPIRFGLAQCWYPEDQHQKWRPIVEFTKVPKPQAAPVKVKLEGKFDSGVQFVVEYEFKGNTITVTGGYEDPPGLKPASVFRIATYIPPSHTIPPDMEQADREKLLDGMLLRTREKVEGRSKTFKYHYAKSLKFAGMLDHAEIQGPWAERVIKFSGRKNDLLRGWAYQGNCPWQGYLFFQDARDNEIKKYKAEQIIVIE